MCGDGQSCFVTIRAVILCDCFLFFRIRAPGGNRNTDGTLNNVGSNGNWWSSDAVGGDACYRNLRSDYSGVFRYSLSQANGYSVRCLSYPESWSNVKVEGAIMIEEMPCGLTIFDSRDGNAYETVQIGDQCWFAEDLRYECDNYYPSASTWTGTECADQGEGYDGLLYQWEAAVNYQGGDKEDYQGAQGLCPDGWHIPTDEELKVLEGYVDSTYDYPDSEWDKSGSYRGVDAGDQLKDPDEAWCYGTPCGQSGWNALPGGYRNTDGPLGFVGSGGRWWSSGAVGGDAWFRYLYSGNSGVYRYSFSQAYGHSVRCLRD